MQPQLKSFYLADKSSLASTLASNVIMETRAAVLAARSIAAEWVRRWRDRRELRSLSKREIADFCPKLTEALKEAEKPFWRC